MIIYEFGRLSCDVPAQPDRWILSSIYQNICGHVWYAYMKDLPHRKFFYEILLFLTPVTKDATAITLFINLQKSSERATAFNRNFDLYI